MDSTDRKILSILVKDARSSNTAIAREIGVSEGTVRKRIAQMVASGSIKGFTVIPGGETLVSIIMIKTDPEYSDEVLRKLRERYPEVYEWSGIFDYSVRIIAESLEAINREVDAIRDIEGVVSTDTLIRLN